MTPTRSASLAAALTVAAVALTAAVVPSVAHHADGVPARGGPDPRSTASVTFEDPGFVPGQQRLTRLTPPRTFTATGTATLRLGPRPASANAVVIRFGCLTAGHFGWPDGAGGETCGPGDADGAEGAANVLDLRRGQTSLTFTAGPHERWRLIARYVHARTTAWGVNASGQTYGTANERGEPDRRACYATNGRFGYCLTAQLDAAAASPGRVPVYEPDGITIVGTFRIRPGRATSR